MKTKNQAIKHARANVGQLYRFGGNYRYNRYDTTVRAWRESTPLPIHLARAARSQALVATACEYLEVDPPQYDGGNWTQYVNA